jgi:hypothetical protein
MIKIVSEHYDERRERTSIEIINTDYKRQDGSYYTGYGYAECSVKDDPDRKVGHLLALDRAKRNLYRHISDDFEFSNDDSMVTVEGSNPKIKYKKRRIFRSEKDGIPDDVLLEEIAEAISMLTVGRFRTILDSEENRSLLISVLRHAGDEAKTVSIMDSDPKSDRHVIAFECRRRHPRANPQGDRLFQIRIAGGRSPSGLIGWRIPLKFRIGKKSLKASRDLLMNRLSKKELVDLFLTEERAWKVLMKLRSEDER